MDAVVGKNNAGDLFLTFVNWNYQQPKPLRAGSERRAAREKDEGVTRRVVQEYADVLREPSGSKKART